jgi:hypothetical protein
LNGNTGTITYTVTIGGAYYLKVVGGGGAYGNYDLAISGHSVPNINIDPSSFGFGGLDVGGAFQKLFAVSNTGTSDLLIGDIGVDGDPEFTVQTDFCSQVTLSQNETCTFVVIFSPIEEGLRRAAVQIPSNDPGKPTFSVFVSGSGVENIYESPRLLETQWEQYKFEYDANNDGTWEEYYAGCTTIAIGQLINYYLQKHPDGWLDRILEEIIVFPRFRISDPEEYWVIDFYHPGCNTLDMYPETHADGVFRVSTATPCDVPADDPLITFLWNVALGLDSQFEQDAGTGVQSYGTELEPYHWVGDDTQQKIKSLLLDRFRFNQSLDEIIVSEKLTQLNQERAYIVNSINDGHPILIAMYRIDSNGEKRGHSAIIDQYRIEANGDFKVKINMGWGETEEFPDPFSDAGPSGKWYSGNGSINASGSRNYTEFYIFKNLRPNRGDLDNDGMLDDWEYAHFGDLTRDGTGDFDIDGLSDLEEFKRNTDPKNQDTDEDGTNDGDEVKYGTDPLTPETININLRNKDVVVSLTGNNRIFVEVVNRYIWLKTAQFELTQLDTAWYTIAPEDQSFTLLPFERKIIPIQLHLPPECEIPATDHPFSVNVSWEHGDNSYSSIDTGNLHVTPNPNVYTLAIPRDTKLSGNTIFAAWKTDIPATTYLYYRKLGEEYTQVPVATDSLEHRVMLPDLEYFTFYELYTESH